MIFMCLYVFIGLFISLRLSYEVWANDHGLTLLETICLVVLVTGTWPLWLYLMWTE